MLWSLIIILDFFWFIFIWFLPAHSSHIFIVCFRSFLPYPIIARSSAYANTCFPLSLSYLIRSSNIIMKIEGESTPPCITPFPILISSFPTRNFVCLYSHLIVAMSSSSMPICSLILSKTILWSTLSNADLRSM